MTKTILDFITENFLQFTDSERNSLLFANVSLPINTNNIARLNTEIIELDKAGEAEKAKEARQKLGELTEYIEQAKEEQNRIYRAAEERYYKSVTTEQAILDDARKVLAVADKTTFEKQQSYTRKIKEFSTRAIRYIEEYGEGEPATAEARAAWDKIKDIEITFTYTDYLAFLVSATYLQAKALNYNKISTKTLTELIIEQAAAAYPPTPEEQAQPEPEPAGILAEEQLTDIIIQAPLDNTELAVDKVNVNFVNLLKDAAEGQIAFAIDTIMANPSKQEPLVTVSVDFTGLEENITKSISYFDKRVMAAINTLWENGETLTTFSRVYVAMGGKGRPAASDIDKIKNSIIKQMTILLKLSNKLEVEQGYKYDAIDYAGNLLLVQIMPVKKNGKAVEGGIQIYGKPPLIDFAKKRKQITTIPLKMLQAPINKTERNLAIEDYIQYRVCRERNIALDTAIQKYTNSKTAKSISIDKKMLYTTILEKAAVNGRMAQHRAKDTIQKIFDFYAKENIKDITACKYEADAVIVTYTFTPEQIAQEKAARKAAKGSEKLLH